MIKKQNVIQKRSGPCRTKLCLTFSSFKINIIRGGMKIFLLLEVLLDENILAFRSSASEKKSLSQSKDDHG